MDTVTLLSDVAAKVMKWKVQNVANIGHVYVDKDGFVQKLPYSWGGVGLVMNHMRQLGFVGTFVVIPEAVKQDYPMDGDVPPTNYACVFYIDNDCRHIPDPTLDDDPIKVVFRASVDAIDRVTEGAYDE